MIAPGNGQACLRQMADLKFEFLQESPCISPTSVLQEPEMIRGDYPQFLEAGSGWAPVTLHTAFLELNFLYYIPSDLKYLE